MAENQLPKGWVETTIKDINLRKSQNINPYDFPDEEFESYSVPIFETGKPEIVEGKEIKSSKQLVFGNEVLISKINPRINRVWEVSNYTENRNICSSEWIIVDTKDVIDSSYLKYLFSAPFFRVLLQSEVSGVGGSLTRARPKLVENYKIPLPPLAEQQRIVAKLDKLFAHLEETKTRLNKIPQLLKNFRQSVLTQAVTGKLTEDWRKENKISIENYSNEVKLNSFKPKEKLEEIVVQDDYLTTPLGKIISIKSGDSLSAKNRVDGKIPVYGGNGITGFHNSFNTTKRTVVIGRVGFYCGSIHITPNEAWITDNAFKVSFSKEILDLDFLSLLLKDANLREVSKSTAQPVISGGKVYPFRVKLFSQKEQIQIVKRYNEVIQLCEKIETRYTSLNKQLGNLPQSILTKAFKGELVQQLPTDGDAQELLNEIQKLKAQTTKKKKK